MTEFNVRMKHDDVTRETNYIRPRTSGTYWDTEENQTIQKLIVLSRNLHGDVLVNYPQADYPTTLCVEKLYHWDQ